MAKILVEGYKLPKTIDVIFTDVSADNSFKDYISVLATENITIGYSDGSFKPSQKLARQHFAVFMARMLDDQFKPSAKPEPKPDPTPNPKPDPDPDFESGLYVISGAPTSFKNCTEMRKYYPNGVKKGHPAYESKRDRDNDNWACEK